MRILDYVYMCVLVECIVPMYLHYFESPKKVSIAIDIESFYLKSYLSLSILYIFHGKLQDTIEYNNWSCFVDFCHKRIHSS